MTAIPWIAHPEDRPIPIIRIALGCFLRLLVCIVFGVRPDHRGFKPWDCAAVAAPPALSAPESDPHAIAATQERLKPLSKGAALCPISKALYRHMIDANAAGPLGEFGLLEGHRRLTRAAMTNDGGAHDELGQLFDAGLSIGVREVIARDPVTADMWRRLAARHDSAPEPRRRAQLEASMTGPQIDEARQSAKAPKRQRAKAPTRSSRSCRTTRWPCGSTRRSWAASNSRAKRED